MSNMEIGGIELRHNPTGMTVVRPVKAAAALPTYEGIAYFSWGASIVGRDLTLTWTFMESDEFDDLDDLYQADAPVVFDPQDGSDTTYIAEITELVCEYFRTLGVSEGQFRTKVEMTLLILAEVT